MNQELIEECADWIAGQMQEEGYLIDPALVQRILETEQDQPVRVPRVSHQEAATGLVVELEAAGVRGIPEAVHARLVMTVLEWEDEFLALAGRPR